MPRRTTELQPTSVKELALSLPAQAFQTITWREGSNAPLSGRLAALRVRHAGGNTGKARLRPLQWLIVEWPQDQAEPCKYILSTLPEDTPIVELVSATYQRWRIERDYQELKQGFGLGHYEGRGLRHVANPITTLPPELRTDDRPRAVPLLWQRRGKTRL